MPSYTFISKSEQPLPVIDTTVPTPLETSTIQTESILDFNQQQPTTSTFGSETGTSTTTTTTTPVSWLESLLIDLSKQIQQPLLFDSTYTVSSKEVIQENYDAEETNDNDIVDELSDYDRRKLEYFQRIIEIANQKVQEQKKTIHHDYYLYNR